MTPCCQMAVVCDLIAITAFTALAPSSLPEVHGSIGSLSDYNVFPDGPVLPPPPAEVRAGSLSL